MGNTNLHAAKTAKNNEFYTRLVDIEKELFQYREYFKDKVIYCNCDSKESNFWWYFTQNFEFFGIKKLILTHFRSDAVAYKLEITKDENCDGKINRDDAIKTTLKMNGDFRSPECIELLKEADIVVTNPAFSLFREFVAQLIEYDKKFIIIGNKNAITYKEIFKLMKDNKIWLGKTSPKGFIQPDGSIKKFGNVGWFTNLETKKRYEDIILYKTYNPEDYPKYDNFNAINVDKVKDIPIDYAGCMGVPVTFMDHYVPDQFKIMGQMSTTKVTDFNYGYPYINGNKKYSRIIIRNKRLGET